MSQVSKARPSSASERPRFRQVPLGVIHPPHNTEKEAHFLKESLSKESVSVPDLTIRSHEAVIFRRAKPLSQRRDSYDEAMERRDRDENGRHKRHQGRGRKDRSGHGYSDEEMRFSSDDQRSHSRPRSRSQHRRPQTAQARVDSMDAIQRRAFERKQKEKKMEEDRRKDWEDDLFRRIDSVLESQNRSRPPGKPQKTIESIFEEWASQDKQYGSLAKNNEFISKTEFRAMLGYLKVGFTKEEIEHIFSTMDTNQDKNISKAEFINRYKDMVFRRQKQKALMTYKPKAKKAVKRTRPVQSSDRRELLEDQYSSGSESYCSTCDSEVSSQYSDEYGHDRINSRERRVRLDENNQRDRYPLQDRDIHGSFQQKSDFSENDSHTRGYHDNSKHKHADSEEEFDEYRSTGQRSGQRSGRRPEGERMDEHFVPEQRSTRRDKKPVLVEHGTDAYEGPLANAKSTGKQDAQTSSKIDAMVDNDEASNIANDVTAFLKELKGEPSKVSGSGSKVNSSKVESTLDGKRKTHTEEEEDIFKALHVKNDVVPKAKQTANQDVKYSDKPDAKVLRDDKKEISKNVHDFLDELKNESAKPSATGSKFNSTVNDRLPVNAVSKGTRNVLEEEDEDLFEGLNRTASVPDNISKDSRKDGRPGDERLYTFGANRLEDESSHRRKPADDMERIIWEEEERDANGASRRSANDREHYDLPYTDRDKGKPEEENGRNALRYKTHSGGGEERQHEDAQHRHHKHHKHHRHDRHEPSHHHHHRHRHERTSESEHESRSRSPNKDRRKEHASKLNPDEDEGYYVAEIIPPVPSNRPWYDRPHHIETSKLTSPLKKKNIINEHEEEGHVFYKNERRDESLIGRERDRAIDHLDTFVEGLRSRSVTSPLRSREFRSGDTKEYDVEEAISVRASRQSVRSSATQGWLEKGIRNISSDLNHTDDDELIMNTYESLLDELRRQERELAARKYDYIREDPRLHHEQPRDRWYQLNNSEFHDEMHKNRIQVSHELRQSPTFGRKRRT
eukprot:GILJ01007438.1.p1 GENE.GILJ01007438.1~~GILJ01007438.1.p1  ORF type:complete len:1018 (-),score=153.65 GILJ01007438.1:119-3172(-)